MKKKNVILILVLLMIVVFTTGCSRKNVSGKGTKKEFSYEADSFSEIEICDIYVKDGNNTFGPKVNILPGSEKKITISMDENFENEISIKKDENKKIIQGKKTHTLLTDGIVISVYGYVLSEIELSGACEATISSECLNKTNLDIELSGASTFNLDTYAGINLKCELSGASVLAMDDCKVENAFLELSGASTVSISNLKTAKLELDLEGASRSDLLLGTTNNFIAEVSGASEVRAKSFELLAGNVELSGASLLYIKVNQSLTGEASGASILEYSGEGNVLVNATGGSSVKKIA